MWRTRRLASWIVIPSGVSLIRSSNPRRAMTDGRPARFAGAAEQPRLDACGTPCGTTDDGWPTPAVPAFRCSRSIQYGCALNRAEIRSALVGEVPARHHAAICLVAKMPQYLAGVRTDAITSCPENPRRQAEGSLQFCRSVSGSWRTPAPHGRLPGVAVMGRDVLDERRCHPRMQLRADFAQPRTAAIPSAARVRHPARRPDNRPYRSESTPYRSNTRCARCCDRIDVTSVAARENGRVQSKSSSASIVVISIGRQQPVLRPAECGGPDR